MKDPHSIRRDLQRPLRPARTWPKERVSGESRAFRGTLFVMNAQTLILPDGRQALMRRATPEDAEGIFLLYQAVYEGTYTLPIVNLREERRAALSDPGTLWLVDEIDGRIVGSVIFSVDGAIRCGKVFAAAVVPECRRGELMFETLRAGIDHLLYQDGSVDVIYATTRTQSVAPSRLLRKLGFVSMGIFPNVHRLIDYETHGLMAIFHPAAWEKRSRPPVLIPEVNGFYEIVRDTFGLEPAQIEAVTDRLKLHVTRGDEARHEYERLRAAGELVWYFFPFHRPNLMFSTESGSVQAFLNREGKDGHGVVVGLKIDRESVAHLEHVLEVVVGGVALLVVGMLAPVESHHVVESPGDRGGPGTRMQRPVDPGDLERHAGRIRGVDAVADVEVVAPVIHRACSSSLECRLLFLLPSGQAGQPAHFERKRGPSQGRLAPCQD